MTIDTETKLRQICFQDAKRVQNIALHNKPAESSRRTPSWFGSAVNERRNSGNALLWRLNK